MGRSALPSTDRSTVWLADLIEATEVVAASAQPCDPASSAIVCRCPPMFGRGSSRPIWERADRNCPSAVAPKLGAAVGLICIFDTAALITEAALRNLNTPFVIDGPQTQHPCRTKTSAQDVVRCADI
jgi:hypothetical protein